MINHWIRSSVPSPSLHDAVIEKKEGKRVRITQVRQLLPNGKLESIECNTIQKRFHTEIDNVIYENWRFVEHELLQEEYLNKGKNIPTKGTFCEYKPDCVKKRDHLN